MRKLFTTLALACSLSMFASAADETVTYTTSSTSGTNRTDAMLMGVYLEVEFTLSDALFASGGAGQPQTYTQTEASDGSTKYASDTVKLDRVTFFSIAYSNTTFGATRLGVYDGGTLVATSQSGSAGTASSLVNPNVVALTFLFDSEAEPLAVGKTYTLKFYVEEPMDVVLYNSDDSGMFDIVSPDRYDGQRLAAEIVVSATVSADAPAGGGAAGIPEPTTATLSLLALVGLAARRRRK